MNQEEMTLFDKVKESVNKGSIIFDKYDSIHSNYNISNDMISVIYNSFGTLCSDSNKRYNSMYDRRNHEKSKYCEELIDGPIKYTVYSNDGYPKGFVHRIDIQGISYSMEPNSRDIIVTGSYTNFYTTESNNTVIDTIGITQYQIRYGNDGLIKNIVVNFRASERDRNRQDDLHDLGYQKIELGSIEELIQLRNRLSNYDYAINLLNNEHEKRI